MNDIYSERVARELVNELNRYTDEMDRAAHRVGDGMASSDWSDEKSRCFYKFIGTITGDIKEVSKAVKDYNSHFLYKINNF